MNTLTAFSSTSPNLLTSSIPINQSVENIAFYLQVPQSLELFAKYLKEVRNGKYSYHCTDPHWQWEKIGVLLKFQQVKLEEREREKNRGHPEGLVIDGRKLTGKDKEKLVFIMINWNDLPHNYDFWRSQNLVFTRLGIIC